MKPSNKKLTTNESTEEFLKRVVEPVCDQLKVVGSKLDKISKDLKIIKQSVASTKKMDGKCAL